MRWIVASSLRFRRLLLAVAAGMLIVGITQLRHLQPEQLPEFKPTMVEVRTEALGLSAAEVEQLITVPLEHDLLNGVAFLDEIYSESRPGLSSVVMIFEPGTDLLDARQVVAEKVSEAAVALPAVSTPPQMLQPLSSTSRVLMARLSSQELSPIEMSVLARWVINPRLLSVDGVANVSVWGFRDQQLQVLVDPERLRQRGVTLQQIISTTGNALWVSPLTFLEASTPGTAGWIDTPNQRLAIRHILPIDTAEELAQVPLEGAGGEAVTVDGESLRLGDVAQVVEDHQPLIGDALFREGSGLLLVVEKFPEANTVEVTREVEEALAAMRPGLGGMEIDTTLFRPATYIETSIGNLSLALLAGGILLMLILALILFEWRTVVISAVAIALSLVTAGMVLYLLDASANMLVVAGLVMAVGVVIADAVTDAENLAARVGHAREEHPGSARWQIILEGSLEMRSAMVYAVLIVLAALVPAFFMEGPAGAFLPPLVLSFAVAVAASMAVALTVTPALAMFLLPAAGTERRGSPVIRRLGRGHDRVLSRVVRRPGWAYLALGVIGLAGIATFPFLERSLSPTLKESNLLIRWEAPPGTSLPEMNRVTTQAVRELGGLDGIGDVSAHVGRAINSDQVVGINSGEIWVDVDPSADYEATVAAIDRTLSGYPGLSHDVLTYPEEKITEVFEGTGQDVVVRIYGENAQVRRTKAAEVRSLLTEIEGITRPTIELPAEEPTLEVEVDVVRAQRHGVKPGDVRRAAATLLSGVAVGNLFEELKVFDVVVWGTPDIRQNVSDVRELLIDVPGGRQVRLEDVAEVRIASNPTVIRHESVASYVDVTADVVGRSVPAAVEDVRRALDRVSFPLEHHAELLGTYAQAQAAGFRLVTVAVAAVIGIFLLLQAAFMSWRLALLVFAILPAALAGGALAALVGGGTITIGSVAGFAAVLGIAARDGILLVRRYQDMEREGALPFGRELVLRGTGERLTPVVGCALATGLALLPMVVVGDVAGLEIVRPMAIVMLGGLVTSTLLVVLALPSLYLRHGRVRERDTVPEELTITLPEVEPVSESSEVVER